MSACSTWCQAQEQCCIACLTYFLPLHTCHNPERMQSSTEHATKHGWRSLASGHVLQAALRPLHCLASRIMFLCGSSRLGLVALQANSKWLAQNHVEGVCHGAETPRSQLSTPNQSSSPHCHPFLRFFTVLVFFELFWNEQNPCHDFHLHSALLGCYRMKAPFTNRKSKTFEAKQLFP